MQKSNKKMMKVKQNNKAVLGILTVTIQALSALWP